MDIKSNGVDVSSFLLVEESADSEMDTLTCERWRPGAVSASAGDEYDAESCSFETTSEIQAADDFDYNHDQGEELIRDVDEQRRFHLRSRSTTCCKFRWADADADDDDDEEEEEEEEYSSWDIGINNNLSRKLKDEMEDRLFWETCMAVGYP